MFGDKTGVTGMRIKNAQTGAAADIALQGVFIAIGHKPNTEIFAGQLEMENGYIVPKVGTQGQCHGNVNLRRIRCPRGAGPYLSPGRDQRRIGLRGRA